jgi:predicted SnoaL-like aldol condensation-catalyzing enzyme
MLFGYRGRGTRDVIPYFDQMESGCSMRKRPQSYPGVTVITQRRLSAAALLASALVAMDAMAQQVPANPAPGCTTSKAEMEANKKIAMGFFSAIGPDRVALADPGYKQHNPIFVKRGAADKLNDYEEFKKTFLSQTAAPPPPVSSVRPPQGNPLEVVTAECDMVTVVHKLYRQDPTEPPGTFYEVFTFDTFRLRNGKLVEHWDSATIAPPSP